MRLFELKLQHIATRKTKGEKCVSINVYGVKRVVRSAGVEPTTYGFGGRHSIQLSYERFLRM